MMNDTKEQPKELNDKDQLRELVSLLRSEYETLYQDQNEWRGHWLQVSQYFDPYSGRYLSGQTHNGLEDSGRRKDQYRINNTPSKVMKVYQAVLAEGLIPQGREFFGLKTADRYYMGSQKVKQWLYDVRGMILDMMAVNGFYKGGKQIFRETGQYGSGQMLICEHPTRVSHCKTYTAGEYVWGLDAYGEVGSSQTKMIMTGYSMAEEFGMESLPASIQQTLKDGKYHEKYVVYHAVFPAGQYKYYNKLKRQGGAGMSGYTWYSCYYTDLQDQEKQVLRMRGYYSRPLITPRAMVDGCSVYGRGDCMDALGDNKMLQKIELMKTQGLGNNIAPAIVAPQRMKPIGVRLYPNAITYTPEGVDPNSIKPIFSFQFPIAEAQIEIDRIENRIKEMLHYNEFLAVLALDKNATAFEVAKRIEEKIMVIGPTLDYLKTEFIAPSIERMYNILLQQNLLPPAPDELPEGAKLTIEYTSILAKAQQMIGTSTFEQALDYQTRMAQVFGEKVLQNVNADRQLRDYFDLIGMSPMTLNSQEDVDAARENERQQMQLAQTAALAQSASQTAKTASEAKVGDSNVLERLVGKE